MGPNQCGINNGQASPPKNTRFQLRLLGLLGVQLLGRLPVLLQDVAHSQGESRGGAQGALCEVGGGPAAAPESSASERDVLGRRCARPPMDGVQPFDRRRRLGLNIGTSSMTLFSSEILLLSSLGSFKTF